MQEYFFILGYPRSRTTWSANFLTSDNSFCWHDMPVFDAKDVKRKFNELPYRYVGLTRTFPIGVSELFDEFPSGKFVVIERDKNEAMDSFVKFFETDHNDINRILDFFDNMEFVLNEVKQRRNVCSQKFNEFDPVAVWNHCISGIKLDYRRLSQLVDFRVNIKQSSKEDIRATLKNRLKEI